jgi:hypothetical protein
MSDTLESSAVDVQGGTPLAGLFKEWLGRVELGEAQALGELTIVPILSPAPAGERFVLLHQALENGTLTVKEVGSGHVNEVIAHNSGDRPVLVLEGESIVGAKQNRLIAMDVLVAPGKDTPIPVGCVEQGRWHWSSPAFTASESTVDPELRRSVRNDYARHGGMDQGKLWHHVLAKLAHHRVSSPTSDYLRLVKERRLEADKHARSIEPLPGQVGLLALREGVLVGLDVVGHPESWASLSRRVLHGYAMSDKTVRAALGSRSPERGEAKSLTAEAWMREVAGADLSLRPSPGLGRQLALMGEHVTGGGLWLDEQPVRLAVFARESEE